MDKHDKRILLLNMDKHDKHILLLIVFIFCIVILGCFVPFLLYQLSLKAANPDIGHHFEAGDLLDFYGSILSCVITVFILVITIMFENKARKKEEILMYKPIIEYIGLDKSVSYTYKRLLLCAEGQINDDVTYKEYKLVFENVGRGESENTKLIINQATAIDDGEKQNNRKKNLFLCVEQNCNNEIGEIISDDCFGIHLQLPERLILPRKYEPHKLYKIPMKMKITYDDMFGLNSYTLNISIIAEITLTPPSDMDTGRKYHEINYKNVKVSPSRNMKFKDYWYDCEKEKQ